MRQRGPPHASTRPGLRLNEESPQQAKKSAPAVMPARLWLDRRAEARPVQSNVRRDVMIPARRSISSSMP